MVETKKQIEEFFAEFVKCVDDMYRIWKQKQR